MSRDEGSYQNGYHNSYPNGDHTNISFSSPFPSLQFSHIESLLSSQTIHAIPSIERRFRSAIFNETIRQFETLLEQPTSKI